MNEFKEKTVILNVSKIDENGWWQGNSIEQVMAHTKLGDDFTENVYNPSSELMTAKYNKTLDKWIEVKDKTNAEFRDENGNLFFIGTQDGEYPEWAITTEPPEYNNETQTIFYKNNKWDVNEILIGKDYYSSDGKKHKVMDINFVLPEECTYQSPPDEIEGVSCKLINNEWVSFENHIGEIIYNTEDSTKTKIVRELGEIETGYTLIKPLPCSTWSGEKWVQKVELIKVAKKNAVTMWRDQQENAIDTKVIVSDIEWDANPKSRTRLTSALLSTMLPEYWTDADNNDQPITREILQQINDEITALGFVIHERQRKMKTEIDNLTTFTDVESYVIGWAN